MCSIHMGRCVYLLIKCGNIGSLNCVLLTFALNLHITEESIHLALISVTGYQTSKYKFTIHIPTLACPSHMTEVSLASL